MSQEDLESRIRETPLIERLEQAQDMIATMCSERRPPKMSIPVRHYDEDVFIITTLRDAIDTLSAAKETHETNSSSSSNSDSDEPRLRRHQ